MTRIDTLKQVWKETNLEGNTPYPKIAFIVVGKRHHVRFFPNRDGDKDPSGNLKAGCVVDTEITTPFFKTTPDFYLQSHSGLLGSTYLGIYLYITLEVYRIFFQRVDLVIIQY